MLTFLYDGVEEGKLAESALRGYLIFLWNIFNRQNFRASGAHYPEGMY